MSEVPKGDTHGGAGQAAGTGPERAGSATTGEAAARGGVIDICRN
jgi:hypothetical protein